MTTPIELIKERLREIAVKLKDALNNHSPERDINKLTSLYNQYFVAFQIIQNHTDIDHEFSRLYLKYNKKFVCSEVHYSAHRNGISHKKLKKC